MISRDSLLVNPWGEDGFMYHDPGIKDKSAPHRNVGVEIEVATFNYESPLENAAAFVNVANKWGCSVGVDDSIPEGIEVRTAPARGSAFTQQVEEVNSAILRIGGMTSSRCGLHVHVDLHDFDVYDLRRLIILYGMMEPFIFSYCLNVAGRLGNRFCVPMGPSLVDGFKSVKSIKGTRALLHSFLYDHPSQRDMPETKRDRGVACRYDALNLHSFFYRGTVEFRHSRGVLSSDVISQWGKFCAKLVDFAFRSTESSLWRISPLDLFNEFMKDFTAIDASHRKEPHTVETISDNARIRAYDRLALVALQ